MKTSTGIKIAVAIAGGLAAVYLVSKASKTAAGVVNAVNPLNNDNIINRGFTSVYQTVTGSDGTLGGDLYDVTHPPGTENTNVINGAVTSLYRSITGSTGTIGGDLYDWLHPEPLNKPTPLVAKAPPVDYTILDARDAMALRSGYTSPTTGYYGN